ncbi:hypothetical protein HEQ60_06940 [Haematospirillum sp. H1815]|uniref:amino acid kinase family protein n=1 Tax=Haematospirillum sp. H1815 TaxID=2723108 RepID=UPI00143B9E2B|nr:hypothetical protein [Haematospirillum sp. H1815]NKD77495.1 hypothetical protein [Haematospirillum sp. H1815]
MKRMTMVTTLKTGTGDKTTDRAFGAETDLLPDGPDIRKSNKTRMPQFCINAFYERKFRDTLFVIKAGGRVIEDDVARHNLLENIRDLTLHGVRVLLVYGGGIAMDTEAEKRGITINKHQGRRITTPDDLKVMIDVLGGRLSLAVYQAMAQAGLEGISLNAVPPDWMNVELRPKVPVDFGLVGDINTVSARALQRLFKVTRFVACPCLAMTEDYHLVNINADTVATALALGTQAQKLIFLSDVDGVQVQGETALMIMAEDIPGLIANGTATGGMKVKLENCLKALQGGVRRIHLISGLRKDALKKEIYEPVSPGTMLIRESERMHYLNEIEAQAALGGELIG